MLATLLILAGGLLDQLPKGPASPPRASGDWLLHQADAKAQVWASDARTVVLSNGLVARTFVVEPDVACIGFDDLVSDRALLRAVEPEARAVVDGVEVRVGGLLSSADRAYLRPAGVAKLELVPHTHRGANGKIPALSSETRAARRAAGRRPGSA
jgi:hypothetical protein